jgi:acyl carrier protein
LDEAGLDSLSTFELKSRIESELGLIVPFGRYMKAASFDELAELVCDLVNEARR